jgi:hypothetical protein
MPVVGGIHLDVAALAFAGAVALATGTAFSLIPAVQAWGTELSAAFRGDARHATTGRPTRWMHSLLAASQIALAFLLIVGARLGVRTFANRLRIDPGYDPHHMPAVDLEFPSFRYEPTDGPTIGRAALLRSAASVVACSAPARRATNLTLILKQGLVLSLLGSAVGLAGALGLTRFLSSYLHGVSAIDPVTFVLVPLLIAAVSLLACLLPACRAMRIDPMVALRYE